VARKNNFGIQKSATSVVGLGSYLITQSNKLILIGQ